MELHYCNRFLLKKCEDLTGLDPTKASCGYIVGPCSHLAFASPTISLYRNAVLSGSIAIIAHLVDSGRYLFIVLYCSESHARKNTLTVFRVAMTGEPGELSRPPLTHEIVSLQTRFGHRIEGRFHRQQQCCHCNAILRDAATSTSTQYRMLEHSIVATY